MPINWTLAKLEYEIFNEPISHVAKRQGCDESVIEEAVHSWNWKRNSTLKEFPLVHLDDLDDPRDAIAITDKIKERLRVQGALKQQSTAPLLARIELTLLHKIRLLADAIDPEDPSGPTSVRKLTSAYNDMRKHDNISVEMGTEEGDSAPSINVNILNQVESGY